MTNKKSTKRSLLLSALSLVLCLSMLVGTTFAWFTDSVTSGKNRITAGNLDVVLEYWDGDSWEDVEGNSDILSEDLWEPGYVDVAYLRLKNAGSLALKYQLGVNIVSETEGVNQKGETFKLSDYIYFDVIEGVDGETNPYANRAAALAVATQNTKISAGYSKAGALAAGSDYVYLALIAHMPTTINNVANHNGVNVPQIDLGINVFATQYTSEEDTFDKYYDAEAGWLGGVDTAWYEANSDATEFTIYTAEELAGLAQIVNSGTDTFAGQTVNLGADLDLNDEPWTPIGNDADQWRNQFNGSFDGNGHTISNLYVVGKNGLGLFGYVGNLAHIEGVTINGAYISGENYVGAVVGFGWLAENCLKDCTVINAEIIATPYLLDDGVTYDGGAKAGAVAGLLYNGNISGNKAIGCSVQAYRDLGGIVGMASGADWAITVSNNTVDDVKLIYASVPNGKYEGNTPNGNMGDIVGRIGGDFGVTIANDNTATNMTYKTVVTYTIDEIKYSKDASTGVVTLTGVTENFTGETLNVPEGVDALRNKALNGNTAIKEVIVPVGLTDFGGTPNAAGTGATGGFFYYSAVEKVTLPEGMTEIPAAAFNQATNLKEVNIPSTVTTIGINAFAGTGLTELTVPATVTSIGYGAFRDMASLNTVTIEGDSVYIPDYTFRNCASLTAIYMKVNTLTLQTGNMAFTNTSTNNENPNSITIYVFNDQVLDTLKNNTHVKCTIVMADAAGTTNELNEKLKAATGETTIVLTDGVFTADLYNISGCDSLTIIGNGADTKLAFSNLQVRPSQFNILTIDNCTIERMPNKSWGHLVFGSSNNASGVYTISNCIFNGVGSQGIFINENVSGATYNIVDCVFNGDFGREGAITIQNNADVNVNVNVSGCTFNNIPETSNEIYVHYENKGLNLTVDGKVTVANAAMLTDAVSKGKTDIYLLDGNYDLNGIQKGGLTLTGVGENVKMANTTKYASGKTTGAIWQAINLKNMTITNTVYTMADGGNSTFTNVYFEKGFRPGHGSGVVFTNCSFGSNSDGYALHFETNGTSTNAIQLNGCKFEGGKVHLGGGRTYAFTNCEFAAGTDFQIWSDITLTNCTVNGETVTAANVATIFPNLNAAKVTFQ